MAADPEKVATFLKSKISTESDPVQLSEFGFDRDFGFRTKVPGSQFFK
jgi:hypothetical protein